MALRVVGSGPVNLHISKRPSEQVPSTSSQPNSPSHRSSIDAHRSELNGLPPRQRARPLSISSKSSDAEPIVLTPTTSNASTQAMVLTPTTSSNGLVNLARTSPTDSAVAVTNPQTTTEHVKAGKAGNLANMNQLRPEKRSELNEAGENSAKIGIYGLRKKAVLTPHIANKMHAALSEMDVSAFTADKNTFNLHGQLMKAGLDEATKQGQINDTEKLLGKFAISIADTCLLIEDKGLSDDEKEGVLNEATKLFSALVPAELQKANGGGRLPTELSDESKESLKLANDVFKDPTLLLNIMINSRRQGLLNADA
jgi:hypothetical protein